LCTVCFWHFHKDCREGRIPSTNSKFWKEKLSKTIERDKRNKSACINLGWKVLVFWECKVEKKLDEVLKVIESELKKAL